MSSTNIKEPPLHQRASIMPITSNEVDIKLLQSAFPIIPSLNSAPKRTYTGLTEHQDIVLITSENRMTCVVNFIPYCWACFFHVRLRLVS